MCFFWCSDPAVVFGVFGCLCPYSYLSLLVFHHIGLLDAPSLSLSPLHMTLARNLLPQKEIHNPSSQKM